MSPSLQIPDGSTPEVILSKPDWKKISNFYPVFALWRVQIWSPESGRSRSGLSLDFAPPRPGRSISGPRLSSPPSILCMLVMDSSGHGPYPRPVRILERRLWESSPDLDFWIKSGPRPPIRDSGSKSKIASYSSLRNLMIPRENNFAGPQLGPLCPNCLFEDPDLSPDLDSVQNLDQSRKFEFS